MPKFDVEYLKQSIQCFWGMFKLPALEVSQAETINAVTQLWWKAWPAIYPKFKIPLQLSAFCFTNVTVRQEIAPKSSFIVLFGTTYEETQGGDRRMKHSASEKKSGHVWALSGKLLWSCSLSKGRWRMNKPLKHIIPFIQVNTMQTGSTVVGFFSGFTHLERLTFAIDCFMAFKTDYQKESTIIQSSMSSWHDD